MAITVTATQGGSPSNGMALRVMVITGAKAVASQSGGSAGTNFASGTSYTVSVTTTQAGSRVYGAGSAFTGGTSSAAASNTTLIDNVLDATNADNYVTFKGTSVTGTPGATSFGFTNTANAGACGPAAYEVLAATTLTEDGSGPAVASTTSATTVTTASFTPPAGSLLVALVAANGSTGSETMTLTDNQAVHLNWTQKVRNTSGAGNDYAGVWVADVPGGAPADQPQVQPGPVWLDLFKPGIPRPRPLTLPAYAPQNEQGTLSIPLPVPSLSLAGLDTLTTDQPQVQPGPVWLDLFKPSLPRPRPVTVQTFALATGSEQGAFSITLPVPSLSLAGLDTLTLDQPQVQPGPVWLDLFKPSLPKSRPLPPSFEPPGEQGTLSIQLPVPALSLVGLDTLTTDQPQTQPGATWLDLFKPSLPRPKPVPPAFAPANEQGALSIQLPVPATVLNGLDTLTLDQPAIQPGSTWTDLFKPGLPRPRPVTIETASVAGEQGTLSIVLPVTSLSLAGLDTLTTDQSQAQPGNTWLGLFKRALFKPQPQPPAYAPANEQGFLSIPLPVPATALSGLDTLTLDQPQVLPGTTWFDLFKSFLPRSRPVPPAYAPPAEQGSLSIQLPVPVTVLSGLDQASSVPGPASVSPGPAWLTLFKPWLPKRPAPTPVFLPGNTESGAFIIVLPPGQRNQAETGALSLPLPVLSLSLAATVAHDGYFALTLPVPATSLTGLTPVNETGAFNVTLPLPLLPLTGTFAHAGNLNISFAVPPPHMSWHAFFMTSDTAGLSRYELFGAESRVTTTVALPVLVTTLAAQLPDPPGTRSYFRGGRWFSARIPG